MLGGDTFYHIGLMTALNRFYPNIPLWFPFAGAGSSLVLGYWVFSYYLAIWASHLTALTMAQWVRILEFVTVPIVCLEIYVYIWIRFKNQIMALFGAILYPLSSMAWGWIAHAGFYAMQISSIFYVPAFLFFDLYLEEELTGSKKPTNKRFYLLGYFVVMAFAILNHGSFWPNFYIGLPLFSLVRSQLNPRLKEKRLISFLRAVKVTIFMVIVGLLAGAFILIPQQKYFSLQPFTPTYGATDTPDLPWKGFLGFERLSGRVGSLYTPLFMAQIVSIFSLVGMVLALLKKKAIGALSVVVVFSVFWLSAAKYLAINLPYLQLFLLPTATRLASATAIYMTILAAYGIWTLADMPSSLLRYLVSKLNKKRLIARLGGFSLSAVSVFMAIILSLVLFAAAFYKTRENQKFPPDIGEWGVVEGYSGYGSLGFRIPFCLVPGWEKQLDKDVYGQEISCQGYMPKNVVDDFNADLWPGPFTEKFLNLAVDENTRVAITPYFGWMTFSFTKHSQASMVSGPAGSSMLNLGWLGIHDNKMFLEGEATQKEVEEIAKWFGTKYVFMRIDEPVSVAKRYSENNWKDVLVEGGAVGKELLNSKGISTLSDKSAILVLGSKKLGAFNNFFQVALKSGISFDDTLIVEGGQKIDEYDLKELEGFKALVLYGYSYKNSTKTWKLLKAYLENGGNIFIDTGWQYVSKDWGIGPDKEGKYIEIVLPNPFPVSKSNWESVGKNWGDAQLTSEIGKDLKLKKFGPPTWGDIGWGMALAKLSDLQPWAEPVLASGDRVIIAKGNYGKGKIVWSGMNLFAHALDKTNQEEYGLIKNIFDFLLVPASTEEGKFTGKWDNPDRVVFTLTEIPKGQAYFYFAETYTPYWKAYWVENGKRKPLKVYTAGPGFMAVKIPQSAVRGRLIMEYNIKNLLIVSFTVTMSVWILIIISLIDAWLFKGWLEKTIKMKIPKLSLFLKINHHRKALTFKDEHENY